MADSSTRRDIWGLALWIYVSAWCSASGWILSGFGYLNEWGYACVLLLSLIGWMSICGRDGWRMPTFSFRHFNPFFQGNPAPRIWLFLTMLAFIGGAAYRPTNYDYLTYRFPRVLHWCAEQHWQWLARVGARMNLSATGFEWLMAPLFIFFKTDRLFFLINFIPYLLFPGLIVSVFRDLGISRRLSWWWMWVLPCGYCFILQAASAGNDCFAAVYLLASLHYLFRARDDCSIRNLALSCLAVALLTGAKASNLPLVLPWLTVLFFHRACVVEKGRTMTMAAILLVAAVISFLPLGLLNIHYTGSYTGDLRNQSKMELTNPVVGVLGNSLQLAKDNLAPPFLPRPIDWKFILPANLKADLFRDFPRLDLQSGELPIEEEAGLGLGVVLFAGLLMIAGLHARFAEPTLIVARNNRAPWVVGAGGVALLAYMAKMGSESTSRLVAAYYPLLIAGIMVMVSLDGRIIRRRRFKWVGFIAMLSAIPVVILSPARPLYPVRMISGIMARSHVPPVIVARYDRVYDVYATRPDVFGELIVFIPPGERAIGFLPGGDDPEAPLWRPFGTRKVIEVMPEDSSEQLKAQDIRFVVVSQDGVTNDYHTTLPSLMAKWSASLVAEKSMILKVHRGPETWYLLSL